MPGFPESRNYYVPIHFKTEEFVPPDVFDARGERSLQLMDWRLLYSYDTIWELANQTAGKRVRLYLNNWLWNGDRKYSGFRPRNCDVGAEYSQHRFGRAGDAISPDVDAQWLRMKIMENNRLFPYITYMEDTCDWLHIDVRYSSHKGIYLFKP